MTDRDQLGTWQTPHRIVKLPNAYLSTADSSPTSPHWGSFASPLFLGLFHFCLLLLLFFLRLSHTQMAPKGDADFCRDQARRDLLALLEGVSNGLLFPTHGLC